MNAVCMSVYIYYVLIVFFAALIFTSKYVSSSNEFVSFLFVAFLIAEYYPVLSTFKLVSIKLNMTRIFIYLFIYLC